MKVLNKKSNHSNTLSNLNPFLFNYTADTLETTFTTKDINNIFSFDNSKNLNNNDNTQEILTISSSSSSFFVHNNDTAVESNTTSQVLLSSPIITNEPTNYPSRGLAQEMFNITLILSTKSINNETMRFDSNVTMSDIMSKEIENITNSYYINYYNPNAINTHFWELDGIIQLLLSINEHSFSMIIGDSTMKLSYIQTMQYLSYASSISFYDILSKPILGAYGNNTNNNTYVHALTQNSMSFIPSIEEIVSFQINGLEQIPQPTNPTPSAKTNPGTIGNSGLINTLQNNNINKNYFLIGLIIFDALLLVSIIIAFYVKRKTFFGSSSSRCNDGDLNNVAVVDATCDNYNVSFRHHM